MQVNKTMVLLIVASLMAGCADAIPEPPIIGDDEEVINEWTTLNSVFTIIVGDENNSTYETIVLGTNTTWLEVSSFNYTATHLSFEIVNNTVIFNNYTFENDGYISQNGMLFSSGTAPNYGTAEVYFPTFPYDITVNYTVIYRTVNGR
tara:strand:- start:6030 stop:6473 length:444 start_codon:yes stop_codon:yes gene_type:complete